MPLLDYQTVNVLKTGTAVAGFVLLAWGWWLARRGRERAFCRTRDGLLALLGVVSVAGWMNFGQFHYFSFVHYHDFLHYYLGSKYFAELGHTRLYRCLAAADIEDGLAAGVRNRWIRNLETNQAEPGTAFASTSTRCSPDFTPERWAAFRDDVRWFRARIMLPSWNRVFMDHGYNATPVWTMIGGWLASAGPASSRQIAFLALLDCVLLVVMWVAVCWAFGWRTLCVAMLWWGTNYPARESWIGGAFLRMDWLAALVVAICLAKRGAQTLAGASLGWAALLRLFPGVAAAGPLAGAIAASWRERTFAPLRSLRGLAIGGVLVCLVALPMTFGSGNGHSIWPAFIANTRKHFDTTFLNSVGLPYLLAFEERTREVYLHEAWLDFPGDMWQAARRRVFASRRPLHWVLVGTFLVVLGLACARQPDWVALTIGVGLIPMVMHLASYYYAVLLVYATLWVRYPAVGVGLLALSIATNAAAAALDLDDLFMMISLAVVLYIWSVTAHVAYQNVRRRSPLAPLDLVESSRPR